MIHIEMRGRLDPVEIPGMDMAAALNALNLAAAQGKPFVLMEKADGSSIAIHTSLVLTFEEYEDE